MPGHVITRALVEQPTAEQFWIDVFDGGQVMDDFQVRQAGGGGGWSWRDFTSPLHVAAATLPG
jgi:hypothetical protein